MALFEAGWRRTGFGSTDDELQYRDRAREALRLLLRARAATPRASRSGSSASSTFAIGDAPACAAASTASTASPTASYELIDYKTGERKSEAELESDLQLALYRLAAREAWEIEAGTGSYYYVLDAEQGRGADQARRRRAGRADRARGRRGHPRPGLRAAPLARRSAAGATTG